MTKQLSKRRKHIKLNHVNPFCTTGLFLYPLKTSEKFWFFDMFRGYRKRPVA